MTDYLKFTVFRCKYSNVYQSDFYDHQEANSFFNNKRNEDYLHWIELVGFLPSGGCIRLRYYERYRGTGARIMTDYLKFTVFRCKYSNVYQSDFYDYQEANSFFNNKRNEDYLHWIELVGFLPSGGCIRLRYYES